MMMMMTTLTKISKQSRVNKIPSFIGDKTFQRERTSIEKYHFRKRDQEMFKKLLFLFLVVASATVGQQQIRQLQLNGAQLIDTSPSNYAIYDQNLLDQNGWTSVNVNGNKITTWSSDCQSKELEELSEADRSSLERSKAKLMSIDGGSGNRNHQYSQQQSMSSSRYSFSGTSSAHNSFGGSGGNQMNSISVNDVQVTLNGDNFSMSKPNLPNNLARVFYSNQVTTFIYLDGRVQVKPTTCLSSDEQQLVDGLKKEVQEMKNNMHQFQSNFNQNMMGMQQNLQNSMENMRYNLQNMNQNIRQNLNNMHGITPPFMPNSFRPSINGQYYSAPMQHYSSSWQSNNLHDGGGIYSNSIVPYGQNSFNPPNLHMFGDSFPFGPQNNPFGTGFPFFRR